MCFWLLTECLTLSEIAKITEKSLSNPHSHGFVCLTCDPNAVTKTLNFDISYQESLIKHFSHALLHHSRITSFGDTNLMNAQPIRSKNGVLCHNGTCNADNVLNVVRAFEMSKIKGISDTFAMTKILDNTPTENIFKKLELFNNSDFIGNLAYIRDDLVYIHTQESTFNEKTRTLQTDGKDAYKGIFNLKTLTFHIAKIDPPRKQYYTNWYNWSAYEQKTETKKDADLETSKDCALRGNQWYCMQDNLCTLHICTFQQCHCPDPSFLEDREVDNDNFDNTDLEEFNFYN